MTGPIRAVMNVLAGRPLPHGGGGPEVVSLLQLHGLAGLAVADARSRSDGADIGDLPQALVDTYRYQALQTTLVLESGRRAVETLTARGIPSLIFKGAALYQAGVYTDPGARFMEDTDLLVTPDRAGEAVAALQDAGFRPWSPWDANRLTWLSSFSLSDGNAPEGTDLDLDLHWATPYARLRQAGPWPPDPLWEGAEGGLPSPEAHFAVIAEHVLKHLRVIAHLKGVGDLVRLAPHLTDGALLREQAERRGSLPGLRTVLAFLTGELGVDVPAGVSEAVEVPERARRNAQRHLAPHRLVGPEGPSGGVGAVLGAWGLIGSPWASFLEWLRVAFPSGSWLRARYPERGTLPRRVRYLKAVAAWVRGVGASPLSPNQELSA